MSNLNQLMMATTINALDFQPIMIFEQPKRNFERMKNKTKLCGSSKLLEKRSKFIECIHLIKPNYAQIYYVEDLHKTPHYSILGGEMKHFLKKCSVLSLPVVIYERDNSYFSKNDWVKVLNPGTDIWIRSIEGMFNQIQFQDLVKNRLENMNVDEKRNNVQKNYGFNTQDFTRYEKDSFSEPKVRKGTNKEIINCMVILTRVLKHVAGLNIIGPVFQVNKRGSTFANKLSACNELEGLTITKNSSIRVLNCHVDNKNCRQKGYNGVIVASMVHDHKRFAVIGYSRKSCGDYFERVKRFEQAGLSRIKIFYLDNKVTKEPAYERILSFDDNNTLSYKTISPHFDCNVSLSCQVWFIEYLGITELYKAVQVISTFGLTDDPAEQFKIFSKWKENSEDINSGSINLGSRFLRYQLRRQPYKEELFNVLNIQFVILDIVLNSFGSMKWSYDNALKTFQRLGNNQQMKADRYLSILILSGMINRNKWIHDRKITTSCFCYKNINLRNPNKKVHCNQLLKALSAQIGKSLSYTRTVMNEFFLRTKNHHDTIIRGQCLYYFYNKKQLSTKLDLKLRCMDAHCRVDHNKTFKWAEYDEYSLIEKRDKIVSYLNIIKSM